MGTSVAAFEGADGNGDGLVDADDFLVWKDHFGEVDGSGSAGVATNLKSAPEPAMVFPVAIALCAAFAVRRRYSSTRRGFVRIAKWLRACFQWWIGLVHFFDAHGSP